MSTRSGLAALLILMGVAGTGPLAGQEPGGNALLQARDSIDQGAFGPALTLIDGVLSAKPQRATAVRLRAFVLRGVTLVLIGGRDLEAVESFRHALLIDPATEVDSLQSLSNHVLGVFEAAQNQVAAEEEARMGELEIRGLPDSGADLLVDDTIWDEPNQQVDPGWHQIRVNAEGYLPLRDSVRVDSGQVVVKELVLVRPPLALSMTIPDSTAVAAGDPWLNVALQTSRHADVSIMLTAPGGAVLQSGSVVIDGRGTARLSLRNPDGGLLRDGAYRIEARAVDTWGVSSIPVKSGIALSRARVDTEPAPAAPAPTSFLPETLLATPGPAAPAIASVVLGALTMATPSLLANSALGSSGTRTAIAYGVGGSITIAGIAGFLSGKKVRPSAVNIRLNAQRRAEYARAVQETAARNGRLREDAPVIVRPQPSAP